MENEFRDSGFFLLRTPLLPFTELVRWQTAGSSATSTDDKSPRRELEHELRECLFQPSVREAIYLSSPSLYTALEDWMERGSTSEYAVGSLARYFARMAARPTPFGLLAGCTVGNIASTTTLTLSGHSRRYAVLDTNYLWMVANAIEAQLRSSHDLVYAPNSSLYRRGGEYRLIETTVDLESMERKYEVVAFETTEPLAWVVEHARPTARRSELVDGLARQFGSLTRDESAEFIDSLIEAQVLVSDLLPSTTSNDALRDLMTKLQRSNADGAPRLESLAILEGVWERLRALARKPIGTDICVYRDIEQDLDRLPVRRPNGSVFRVDLFRPSKGLALSQDVVSEILRGAETLARISPLGPDDALEDFKRRFIERYDTRRVALMEALDEESGIGYGIGVLGDPSPLLDGLGFVGPEKKSWTGSRREAWIARRLQELAQQGLSRWDLTDEDLERLKVDVPRRLPDAFSVMATVIAESSAAVDAGQYTIMLRSVFGPAGANTLARFCAGEQELRGDVERHLRDEEALLGDALFADIVHVPRGRATNVVTRPSLRLYEIPYLSTATVEPERQIALEDLYLSVRAGRFVLESGRLGKRVVPRMTNAHFVTDLDLPVYRLLSALQNDGCLQRTPWRWGVFAEASFLPRITRGNLILAEAMWLITSADLASLCTGGRASRIATFKSLQRKYNWPRWITVGQTDQQLVVDCENVMSIEAGLREATRNEELRITEVSANPTSLCVSEGSRTFAHELVVPFVRRDAAESCQRIANPVSSVATARSARASFPGSDWLYCKVYTGPSVVDRLLRDVVGPLRDEADAAGEIDRWFFIRYGDPQWHLRLRFHGSSRFGVQAVLPRLHDATAKLADDGFVWRIEVDTYEREVERYGGVQAVRLAEEVFHADSDAVLSIICAGDHDSLVQARWQIALLGADSLLESLGVGEPADRLAIMENQRDAFRREYEIGSSLDHQIGELFRKRRREVELLFSSEPDNDPIIALARSAFQRRRAMMEPIVERLSALERADELTVPRAQLARSVVHMHLNRLLMSDHRKQELVIYDFLARYYASIIARRRSR